eukprot:gnl/Chilomastix_cuspidata/2611.p1 GENE.gnl/Chilomastix_cuspidata/2611~~gnl/Chilomastix_cuspidata/2611.p1  ORF type:complete len:466 (-),score=195.70 gnl/Chilomastix_cuspidata/2611:74-1471(-)
MLGFVVLHASTGALIHHFAAVPIAHSGFKMRFAADEPAEDPDGVEERKAVMQSSHFLWTLYLNSLSLGDVMQVEYAAPHTERPSTPLPPDQNPVTPGPNLQRLASPLRPRVFVSILDTVARTPFSLPQFSAHASKQGLQRDRSPSLLALGAFTYVFAPLPDADILLVAAFPTAPDVFGTDEAPGDFVHDAADAVAPCARLQHELVVLTNVIARAFAQRYEASLRAKPGQPLGRFLKFGTRALPALQAIGVENALFAALSELGRVEGRPGARMQPPDWAFALFSPALGAELAPTARAQLQGLRPPSHPQLWTRPQRPGDSDLEFMTGAARFEPTVVNAWNRVSVWVETAFKSSEWAFEGDDELRARADGIIRTVFRAGRLMAAREFSLEATIINAKGKAQRVTIWALPVCGVPAFFVAVPIVAEKHTLVLPPDATLFARAAPLLLHVRGLMRQLFAYACAAPRPRK